MSNVPEYLRMLLDRLRLVRERAGVDRTTLEETLILGPGWIERFETSATVPTIDMILAILSTVDSGLPDLLEGLPEPEAASIERSIFAEETGNDLLVSFRYSRFDAQYVLPSARLRDFEVVIKSLRDGLARQTDPLAGAAEAIKSDSIAQAFLAAVKLWPLANPSDIWWFVIYRAYCDPFNHPARFARLDFAQSWKRAGGWALEEVLVRHYGPYLGGVGINLVIADSATKVALIEDLGLAGRVEADKIDLILTGETKDGPRFFGIVNVKASFAERRTDDVPLSEAMTKAGFTSPLWTMDCKSTPGVSPVNRGELGSVDGKRRSAKRKDIEDEGYFTGCFSYNRNTQPSGPNLPDERRIFVCDFSNPDDAFSAFIRRRWQKFQTP